MADATDLKSVEEQSSCGFESHHRYHFYNMNYPSINTETRFEPLTNEVVTVITIRQKQEASNKLTLLNPTPINSINPIAPLTPQDVDRLMPSWPLTTHGTPNWTKITNLTTSALTELTKPSTTITPTMSALRPLSVEDYKKITNSFVSVNPNCPSYDAMPGLQSIQSNIPLYNTTGNIPLKRL